VRARNIKPGFFKNEDLAKCSPFARILFAALWCLADKDGRLEDRPARIKAEALPYDPVDVDQLLGELYAGEFICRYTARCKRVIQVVNFPNHQSPHRDERSYDLPSLSDETTKFQGVSANPVKFSPESLNQESLKEECGKDAPSGETAASEPPQPAPDDPILFTFPVNGGKTKEWYLRQSKLSEYSETFPGVDLRLEILKALQWCRDNPAKRKTPSGMAAFLSRWLGKVQNGRSGQGAPAHSADKETVRQRLERFRQEQACPSKGTSNGPNDTPPSSGSTATPT
jgi:hypothetical protein